MSLIFTSLTSPEKQVTYFQSGKKLRRYIIRCSSKGTANNPEDANYWLDGEPLGNWSKARDRFMQLKWEKNAVVDVLFDCPNIWTSSGGLYLLPEFGELSRKHGLFLNQHRTHRAEDDD